jgi:mono/diheme cytochrome c family protein
MNRPLLFAIASATVLAIACGGTNGANGDGGTGQDSGGTPVVGADVPCEVANVLATYCSSCHASSASSSGISINSLADLSATSKLDPSKTVAQLCVDRMKDGSMPPAGNTAPTAQEITAFEAWVTGGLAQGSCDPNDGGTADPFAGPHVCTSGKKYTFGASSAMEPGNPCVSCHAQNGGPRLTIAGTVYPTAHEPSRCYATGVTGAVVVITDKNGAKTNITVNSVGNFYSTKTIAMPYTAVVTYMGKSRAMAAAQTSGDCNACHTENGDMNAPGRILLP